MVVMSALEPHPASSILYNEVPEYHLEQSEERMTSHRYYLQQGRSVAPPPTMPRRSTRRMRRGARRNALQQLDDTVASVGSRQGDNDTWNDGDSGSQCSQSVVTTDGDGNPTNHQDLIANMRDIKNMRGRSLPNSYIVGSRSVSSMHSRASHRSLKASTRRKRLELERMICITLLETAASVDADSHFLCQANKEDTPSASMVSVNDILNDLVTTSAIVDQESLSHSPPSPGGHVPRYSRPLLHVTSAESDDPSFQDNVNFSATRTAKPIFFKLQQQARQTIPESEDSPRNRPSARTANHPRGTLNVKIENSRIWNNMDRRLQVSPGPFQPRPRHSSPTTIEPKELFLEPSLTEDGFPVQSVDSSLNNDMTENALSLFQARTEERSRTQVPTTFQEDWNAEWTTFDTSPFGTPGGSPNVVNDSLHPSVHATLSNDSGFGSKYSI